MTAGVDQPCDTSSDAIAACPLTQITIAGHLLVLLAKPSPIEGDHQLEMRCYHQWRFELSCLHHVVPLLVVTYLCLVRQCCAVGLWCCADHSAGGTNKI
jgi:hypothetical protein